MSKRAVDDDQGVLSRPKLDGSANSNAFPTTGISTLSMSAAQAQLQALVAAAPGAYLAAGLQLPPGFESLAAAHTAQPQAYRTHQQPGGGWAPQDLSHGGASHSSAAAREAAAQAADEEGRARGGYKCSKCGLPKKGHVCAYQPRLRRRDEEEPKEKCDMSCQAEMDPNMTVRELKLDIQGTPESYAPMHIPTFASLSGSMGAPHHAQSMHCMPHMGQGSMHPLYQPLPPMGQPQTMDAAQFAGMMQQQQYQQYQQPMQAPQQQQQPPVPPRDDESHGEDNQEDPSLV